MQSTRPAARRKTRPPPPPHFHRKLAASSSTRVRATARRGQRRAPVATEVFLRCPMPACHVRQVTFGGLDVCSLCSVLYKYMYTNSILYRILFIECAGAEMCTLHVQVLYCTYTVYCYCVSVHCMYRTIVHVRMSCD